MSATCPFCERRRNGEYEETRIWNVMRFEPLNPVVPGHMLFVPMSHLADASQDPRTTGMTFEAAARWGQESECQYNLITSAGANATQSVYHLHVHYVPRAMGDGLHLPWTGQKR